MTTLKLTGGSLGSDSILIRCNLSQASAPIQVDWDNGDGWQHTQYQCADARHTTAGLARIGQVLADEYVPLEDREECDWEEVEPTYTVGDANSGDEGLSYDEAVERIAEWYEDVDQWATGHGDDALHDAVAEAIESVERPADGGDLTELRLYAAAICDAVAEAMGGESFSGHGNYHVSAADRIGLDLSVTEDN